MFHWLLSILSPVSYQIETLIKKIKEGEIDLLFYCNGVPCTPILPTEAYDVSHANLHMWYKITGEFDYLEYSDMEVAATLLLIFHITQQFGPTMTLRWGHCLVDGKKEQAITVERRKNIWKFRLQSRLQKSHLH